MKGCSFLNEFEFKANCEAASRYLRDFLPEKIEGIIELGSGFGKAFDKLEKELIIKYDKIPFFPKASAPSHRSQLSLVFINSKPYVILEGRFHLYENYGVWEVIFPIVVLSRFKPNIAYLTNASGGINSSLNIGEVVIVKDHINFTGYNPLIGLADIYFGERFVDMSDAYNKKLRALAKAESVSILGYEPKEVVYVGVLGPSFETPAELNAMRTLGADIVGMSTVMEVIALNALKIKTICFSLISNIANPDNPVKVSAQEVVDVVSNNSDKLRDLIVDLASKVDATKI
ncbi:purine-nucleoside phosphorylase [Thermodesulfobium sp.]|jgi:purine-nucleoside phosphorylase|uniref:Purine nucleoside phosphorylase n=1 Tax=Thermodesulfobium narugense TaxID=184064 RepID=A0A7C5KCM0_9BACT